MEGRSWTILAVTALLGSMAVAPGPLAAQDSYGIETRVWTDRGEDPVVQRGERVRVYYRVTRDAYVALFHIDTDGIARMVFPRSPEENHYVRGGQDYRLLFPRSPYWNVEDDPGVGYYFIVASPEPFDFSAFRYSHYGSGWDLTRVGRNVYRDPYQAIDDYVAYLIPDWEYVPYGLDFVEYRVGQASYRYPRFLCYDCHGFRPYYAWNPYRYTCASFRVVIFDHPYYYPRTRYRGSAVVYTRPPVSSGPRFAFKERGRGEPGTPMTVSSAAPVADRPGVRGDPAPRRPAGSAGGAAGSQGAPSTARPGVPGTRDRAPGRSDAAGSGRRPAGVEPAPPRRPSSVLPGRGGERAAPPRVQVEPRGVDPSRVRRPSQGGSRATPPSGSGGRDRPILQRRPSGGSGGSASPPSRPPARVEPPVRRTPPTAGSGGSGGSRPSRPPVRSGGSSGRTGGSSGGSARPSRGGSSGGSARPSRSGSSGSGASSRRPPARRPSGGGGGDDGPLTVEEMATRDDDAVSVTSLVGSRASRAVPVTSYRPAPEPAESAGGAREPEAGRSVGVVARPRGPASADARPDGAPGTRSGNAPRRSTPSSVVAGASRGSAAVRPSASPGARAGWVVRGARPAATSSGGRTPARTRATSSPTGGRSVVRGSGGSRAGASGAAVSGARRRSAPAATSSGSGTRSSGTVRRASPPPRRDPPGGGGG